LERSQGEPIVVETLSEQTIDATVALQAACFPPPFPTELLWQRSHLLQHLQVFPAGQFVARSSDRVVGSATSLIVSEAVWQAHLPWEITVGGHQLTNHEPSGTTLYGVDISVDPEFRGRGIARALYQARMDLVDELKLRRFGTACRLPGVRDWKRATGRSIQDYIVEVESGNVVDPTLTPLLRLGLSPIGFIEGYMEDEESLDAAALIELSRPT